MYIGPWQEYRLAKIQDNAIQRLRQEWEEQLRGQLPATDDARIRELMQPMMAKLPSLLLAAKSKTTSTTHTAPSSAVVRGDHREAGSRSSSRPASAHSVTSNASSRTRCSTRNADTVSHRHRVSSGPSNQETHDEAMNVLSRAALKPPKPTKKKKKKKKTQLTALEEVQKRKMMFATWIKHAGGSNDSEGGQQDSSRTPGGIGPELATLPREVAPASIVTRLPPISSAVPSSASSLLGSRPEMPSASPVHLPTLSQSSNNVTVLEQHDGSHVAGVLSSVSSPTAKDCEDADLDASLDEDEVNNLLNWTDTLLSPQAMDSFGELDD
ncbi:hypothetical protein BBJ28_00002292 [Nothophytophthora sp. Chile5]|nr:hypothetical protein BBJ28_00002292 [Nothophytophthora sp. Chile5]